MKETFLLSFSVLIKIYFKIHEETLEKIYQNTFWFAFLNVKSPNLCSVLDERVWVSHQRGSPSIPDLLGCVGLEMLSLSIQPVVHGESISVPRVAFATFSSHGLSAETPCWSSLCSLWCCYISQLPASPSSHWEHSFSCRVTGCQSPAKSLPYSSF